jgi:polysaccharide deacetylase family protein (PEP-CTERM system associated)
VLTIDVEEYFQVVNLEGAVRREQWASIPSRVEIGVERLVELLHHSGASATCFVLGCVADRNPGCVRRMAEAGLEIASHGFDHRRLHDLGPEGLDRDLARAEEAIGAATGVRVRGYRAPHFSLDRRSLWAYDVLIDRGYVYDSSIFPGHHLEYGMPDAPDRPFVVLRPDQRTIIEFPIAVTSFAGVRLGTGGGYFRLYPYRLTRFLLRRLARSGGAPVTFYVHPWELDPEQPRQPLPWWRRLRQYQGLHATESRLRRLLAEFQFADVGSIVGELDLEAVALGVAPAAAGDRSATDRPAPYPAGGPIVAPVARAESSTHSAAYDREARRGSAGR